MCFQPTWQEHNSPSLRPDQTYSNSKVKLEVGRADWNDAIKWVMNWIKWSRGAHSPGGPHSQRQVQANLTIGGQRQRLSQAAERAKRSQETQLVEDPPCSLCGSSNHLGDECNFIAVKTSTQVALEEPSARIHHWVIHWIYVLTLDLYCLHYPQFYPGLTVDTLASLEAYLLLLFPWLCRPDF